MYCNARPSYNTRYVAASGSTNTREDPEKIVAKHIALLKEYNRVRDTALGLVNHLAASKQMTTANVIRDLNCIIEDF
jgi:hypothetical protein